MTLVILAHFFVVRPLLGMKKSPLLTLNQTVLLLAAILPRPEFDAQAALDWIQYYQANNLAAKISHRNRRLERFNQRE